jgi:hypothetical protein
VLLGELAGGARATSDLPRTVDCRIRPGAVIEIPAVARFKKNLLMAI